jgi:hypothetical protein
VQAAFEAETVTLDQLLEAQRRRSEAQTSYFRTLLDYQRAIIGVHYRKGSLLEYNNVFLAEGPWPAKAQFDAHRLARQRDASVYLNYGFTRPDVVSQGPVRQTRPGEELSPEGMEMSPMDGRRQETNSREELPVPEEALPSADSGLGAKSSQRLRTASASQGGFEWGPLGQIVDEIEPRDPAWTDKTPEPLSRKPEPRSIVKRPEPAPAANKTVNNATSAVPTTFPVSRPVVQPASHQDWKSASEHEPVQNQSPGPAFRPVTGR